MNLDISPDIADELWNSTEHLTPRDDVKLSLNNFKRLVEILSE